MAALPTLSHQNYTVGWICALPAELAAAMAMLDEEHPPLSQSADDDNVYTLGRIGEHNVVIACFPAGQMGNNSAATVATHMRHSFGATRFGLMVGIGGGVPSEDHDIRLGDVVVSKPGKHNGGVIQYDAGRTIAEGRFVRSGSLNAPPTVLLSAVNTIQARHDLHGHRLAQYLSVMDTSRLESRYTYQGANNDALFEAEYDHVGEGTTCDRCDTSRLVSRLARVQTEPVIHYGTIASGNQVMRHGGTRERWRRESEVLCFEMEAAGLMNNFPCLVIRGICDYADSHKNKRWQEYAAATAAAYAKELLYAIPGNQVMSTRTVNEATRAAESPTSIKRVSTVPFERDKQFAGREETPSQIEEQLRTQYRAQSAPSYSTSFPSSWAVRNDGLSIAPSATALPQSCFSPDNTSLKPLNSSSPTTGPVEYSSYFPSSWMLSPSSPRPPDLFTSTATPKYRAPSRINTIEHSTLTGTTISPQTTFRQRLNEVQNFSASRQVPDQADDFKQSLLTHLSRSRAQERSRRVTTTT